MVLLQQTVGHLPSAGHSNHVVAGLLLRDCILWRASLWRLHVDPRCHRILLTVGLRALLQGAVAGRVWLDSDNNNVVTIGIDEGFEGIVVNLFRIVGSRRTFLGCTQTDGTGESIVYMQNMPTACNSVPDGAWARRCRHCMHGICTHLVCAKVSSRGQSRQTACDAGSKSSSVTLSGILHAGAYRFAGLVSDTYSVQVRILML